MYDGKIEGNGVESSLVHCFLPSKIKSKHYFADKNAIFVEPEGEAQTNVSPLRLEYIVSSRCTICVLPFRIQLIDTIR